VRSSLRVIAIDYDCDYMQLGLCVVDIICWIIYDLYYM